DADPDEARRGLLAGAAASEIPARDDDPALLELRLDLRPERLERVRAELDRVDADEIAAGDDDVRVDVVSEDDAPAAEAVLRDGAHGVVSSTNHSVGTT